MELILGVLRIGCHREREFLCRFFPLLRRFVIKAFSEVLIALFTGQDGQDRKSTRLNSSHRCISYAVFCLKKKMTITPPTTTHYKIHLTYMILSVTTSSIPMI